MAAAAQGNTDEMSDDDSDEFLDAMDSGEEVQKAQKKIAAAQQIIEDARNFK